MRYEWKCPVGLWTINDRPDARWDLAIDGANMGLYEAAELAAGDVRDHMTGFEVWDAMRDGSVASTAPADLSGWAKKS